MKLRHLLLASALAFPAAPALAVPNSTALVVSSCGNQTYVAGRDGPLTVDLTGVLCTDAGGGGGSQDVNLTEVAGNPVATGHGTAAGALRVELPTDGTGVIAGITNPVTVVGNVASGTTDSGNPVKIAAKYNATLPTFTDGDRADLQVTARGSLRTNICNAGVSCATVTNSALDINISSVAGVSTVTGSGTATSALRVELPTNGTGKVGLNAGSAIIGIVGIDQTTPGTTNLVAAAQSGTWTVTGSGGTFPITAATETPVTPNTATATKGTLLAGQYNSSPTTFTNGQQGSIQIGSRGALWTQIMGSDGTTGAAVGTIADTAGLGNALKTYAAPMLYNGSSLDMARAVTNGINSVGTGIAASGILGQFDDVSPGTITENSFGPLRMSTNRNQYVTIRDAAGNERGLNIDASGQISVTSITSSVTPGTAAANLGKAEDAIAGSADTGVMALAVQTATPADSAADGDYANLQLKNGGLFVTGVSNTVGGTSAYFLQPTASDNHANIKNGAGTVYAISVTNNSATVNYLRLYNAGTGFNGCNSATNLIGQWAIPASTAGAGIVTPLGGQYGIAFATGLSICVTSGYATTDTTNATASAMSVNVQYK